MQSEGARGGQRQSSALHFSFFLSAVSPSIFTLISLTFYGRKHSNTHTHTHLDELTKIFTLLKVQSVLTHGHTNSSLTCREQLQSSVCVNCRMHI